MPTSFLRSQNLFKRDSQHQPPPSPAPGRSELWICRGSCRPRQVLVNGTGSAELPRKKAEVLLAFLIILVVCEPSVVFR